jgi:hypothetical protein
MDLINLWLPLFGGGVLFAIAIGAWFAEHKLTGIWFGFFGIMCFILLAALQLQEHELNVRKEVQADPNEIAKKQARAYLGVASIVIAKVTAGQRPHVQIALKNSGQTPAYDVHFWADPITLDEIPAPIYVPIQMPTYPENSGVPVAPGAMLYMSAVLPHELKDIEFNALNVSKGKLMGYALYLKGIVTYLDAFGVRRTTRFYAYYGGPAGLNETGAMASMHEGNIAD